MLGWYKHWGVELNESRPELRLMVLFRLLGTVETWICECSSHIELLLKLIAARCVEFARDPKFEDYYVIGGGVEQVVSKKAGDGYVDFVRCYGF